MISNLRKLNSKPTIHSIKTTSTEREKLNCYEAANKTTFFSKKLTTTAYNYRSNLPQ